jgi:O-antigen ligase
MGVHLMICTILVILNIKKLSNKWLISLAILILFNFLVVAAYSRSGMLAYIVGVFSFIYFSKDNYIKEAIKGFTKYIPWALVIVIPIYLSIQVRENFQGRAAGFTQIKENITSLTTNTDNKISEDNILWRFTWWTKIIDYSFSKEYFLHGKGLGMSLAQSDDIIMTEDDVRSPHSFHLTIMARYGIPLFLLWLYWIFLLIKPLFKRKLSLKEHAITCILISFIVNASFDVFLEGPMGAFPFWTWVGLLFMSVGVTDAKAADSASLVTGSDTNNITDTHQADSITQPNS